MKTPRRQAPQSIPELISRARALCGFRVHEVAQALNMGLPADSIHGKGFVGQLVELVLGADPKACERPDFPDLHVELKTIPTYANGRPAASTFVCSIDMLAADKAFWETSILKQRLKQVLFVPVVAPPKTPIGQRQFGKAIFWQPDGQALELLRQDWEDLMGLIGAGRGGSLSARQGRLLQVRPKAAHANVRTLGYGHEGVEPILPLGFYLRAKFTEKILLAQS